MIADIYGKISSSGSNLSERLEDKLTGDIFGVLRYLPSEKLLMPFLRKAYHINPESNKIKQLELSFNTEPNITFWPKTYSGIEPDVEIIGFEATTKTKIFIEVKYKSGLSGNDEEKENIQPKDSKNQLIRQIRVLANELIYDKKVLVFLTEDGSYPQEILRRVLDSINANRLLSSVQLYWLSWHELKSVTSNLLHYQLPIFEKRIIEDILMYCNKKGFSRYKYYFPKRITRWNFINNIKKPEAYIYQPLITFLNSTPGSNINSKWSFTHE